jgi:hypothetical protein
LFISGGYRYPSLSELLAQSITKLISFPSLFWHLLHISFPEPTKNAQKNRFATPRFYLKFFFGGMMPLFFLFDIIYFIHSFYHIQTVNSSVAIRQSSSPSPHRWLAQWENLLGVPSQEPNSGLPYSKPMHYQLTYAASTNYATTTDYAAPTLN